MAAPPDDIPTLIGSHNDQYYLDRSQLLGDGHSGQVYAGWKLHDQKLQVAIKLDKTSGAKHEWAMLKKMEGSGVPKVHYTGARARFSFAVPFPAHSPQLPTCARHAL